MTYLKKKEEVIIQMYYCSVYQIGGNQYAVGLLGNLIRSYVFFHRREDEGNEWKPCHYAPIQVLHSYMKDNADDIKSFYYDNY